MMTVILNQATISNKIVAGCTARIYVFLPHGRSYGQQEFPPISIIMFTLSCLQVSSELGQMHTDKQVAPSSFASVGAHAFNYSGEPCPSKDKQDELEAYTLNTSPRSSVFWPAESQART